MPRISSVMGFMPTGSFNSLLEVIGLSDLVMPWLVDPATAMNTIVFVNVWAGVGYYMVIILAGLTTIPDDVYEAAAIDGATSIQKFFKITVPMLKPILAMCILMPTDKNSPKTRVRIVR